MRLLLLLVLALGCVFALAASHSPFSPLARLHTLRGGQSDNPRWSLAGKRVVVTGGTLGIGKAIVEECAALGAEVVTCARNEDTLRECLDEWDAKGYNVQACVADVSTEKGRKDLLELISSLSNQQGETNGASVDALINNVGTNVRKRAIEYNDQEYEKIMNTNLHATFHLTKAMYPLLKKGSEKSGTAAVVNIGSVAGGCHSAMKSGVIYAMTKAAVAQMSYNLAVEWAADNIRVNTIAPWYIDTPLVQPVFNDPATYRAIVDHTPMKRVGLPREVSSLAAFLCLDSAAYITGQVVAVDGGMLRNGFF